MAIKDKTEELTVPGIKILLILLRKLPKQLLLGSCEYKWICSSDEMLIDSTSNEESLFAYSFIQLISSSFYVIVWESFFSKKLDVLNSLTKDFSLISNFYIFELLIKYYNL